jgi:hypothetical protein
VVIVTHIWLSVINIWRILSQIFGGPDVVLHNGRLRIEIKCGSSAKMVQDQFIGTPLVRF